MSEDYDKVLEKYRHLIEEFQKNLEKFDELLERFRKSIKHPHFKYAVIDPDKEPVVTYKWKKPWQWFSGKRIVRVKIKPITTEGLPTYERKRTRKN